MKVEVLMPKMGESITEGRILRWAKKPGDSIQRDETIVEISTDKVDTEVPSPDNGIVVQLLANENDTIEVNHPIAIIETDTSAAAVVDTPVSTRETTTRPTTREPVVEKEKFSPPSPSTGTTGSGEKFYSPVVMRIASAEGITPDELNRIPGTGLNGRVTKSDLLTYLERKRSGTAAPVSERTTAAVEVLHTELAQTSRESSDSQDSLAVAGVEIIPMDNIHRIMAEHMVRSKHVSPHVSLVSEADITPIAQFRETFADAFKTREGFSLTFMPFIAEAAIRALKDFPLVNASVDGTNIIVKKFVNLGIAVALESGGLIVPVIRNADALNFTGLGRAINDVAVRARKKRLQPDEIQDGTFTITNYGVFGNLFGAPIINQPQVAILGVGSAQKRAVVIERDGMDLIAVRTMIYISLSFDHRLVDGALGGMYLERVVKYLQEFNRTSI